MLLQSFAVWTRWECFGSSRGENSVPQRNSLSPGIAVLEEGGVKAGKVSWLFFRGGKAEEAQVCSVCLCVQHRLPLVCITLKMFSSPVCLQWLLPATSSVLSSTLSALAHAAFLLCLVQTWLYSFGLPFPLFPCWMEAAEATKISSLLSRKDIKWKHL